MCRRVSGEDVSSADVVWGLAAVHSRAYGTADTLMLTPFADLVNHCGSASTKGAAGGAVLPGERD